MPPEFGDVIYTAEVVTIYKQGDGQTYGEGDEITLITKASSSLCGISMSVGEDTEGNADEYLVGLNSFEGSTSPRAELCGVYADWSVVDVPLLESCTQTPSPSQVQTPPPSQVR